MKTKIPVLPSLSREKLKNILLKIPGKKDLIVDPKVFKPLENILGISVLRLVSISSIEFYFDNVSNLSLFSDLWISKRYSKSAARTFLRSATPECFSFTPTLFWSNTFATILIRNRETMRLEPNST